MTATGYIDSLITVPSSVTISATNDTGGPTSVSITAGSYYMLDHGGSVPSLIDHIATRLNAARPGANADDWTVSLSTTTGLVTIDCADEPYAITFTSTALRDLLGFAGNIASTSSPSIGTLNARGFYIPGATLMLDSYVLAAPRKTNLRQSETPTGRVYGHVGTSKYVHRNLRYSHVERARVFIADEDTTNASWEKFLVDTQFGLGHAWFTNSSKIHIVDHSGNLIGNGTVDGWYAKGLGEFRPVRVGDAWDGLWRIEIPELVSDS